MNFYVGTSGFAFKEWKGPFYPEDLPANLMLHFYGDHFRAVEINNTFYRMPKTSVLETWAVSVPVDFKFALKAPQRITHFQRLRDADDSVLRLVEVTRVLGQRLGPVLFQMPPFFLKDAPTLNHFLGLLPSGCRAAFEFRHPSWFDDEIFNLLRDRDAALCFVEAENELEIPLEATASWGYLRLRRTDYNNPQLAQWVSRIHQQSWREVFVFFKHEEEGRAPLLANSFLELAKAQRQPSFDRDFNRAY